MNKSPETWFLLRSGRCQPPENMAVDEALLEAAPRLGRPILRFYGWLTTAATFGYSQKIAAVAQWTDCPVLIRRPTGGGLVPHESDWTYSLAFPPTHHWYRLRAPESYAAIHEWIHRAFARVGVVTQLCGTSSQMPPGQCFVSPERSDLLWNGRKIAGAAQRRTRHGLLIQGSIQPPELPLSRETWEEAMCSEACVHWDTFEPDAPLRARVDELVRTKYGLDSYNAMR